MKQNDVTNDVLRRKKTRYQKIFFQNGPVIYLSNFNCDKHFVKITLSCSKRRRRGKISEMEQNDVICDSQKRDLV